MGAITKYIEDTGCGKYKCFNTKKLCLDATDGDTIAYTYDDKSASNATKSKFAETNPSRVKVVSLSHMFQTKHTPPSVFKYFLDGIIPTCEEVGVKMACHPDDPAWPVFGLPRITHSQADYDIMVKLHDSPANTLCLCTGSLGSNPDNDIPAIIRHFGEMDRIGAMHVRNVKILDDGSFEESAHFSACGSLDIPRIMKILHDNGFTGYVRPDHGRNIWDEGGKPGYGLYDRALGAAYINGLFEMSAKRGK